MQTDVLNPDLTIVAVSDAYLNATMLAGKKLSAENRYQTTPITIPITAPVAQFVPPVAPPERLPA
jgi:hypothetical protein